MKGTLYINGPAKFTEGDSFVSDWFDGLGMVHAFTFDGNTFSYRNKFLETDDYEFVKKTGKMTRPSFKEDPWGSVYELVASLFKEKRSYRSNANVALTEYSGRLIALTETPSPVEIDSKTLQTRGAFLYNDGFPEKDIHDTAHIHYDFERKEHLGYFTEFGYNSYLHLFRIKDGSTKREIISSIKVKEPSYMHSFAITERYAVLIALPMVVRPLDLLLSDAKNFFKSFKWKPERGTQLIVIDRIENKLVGIYKTEPFFAWHTVNAFEKDNSIVLDWVAYPDNSVIKLCFFDNLLAPVNEQISFTGARLKRYTIDLTTGCVAVAQITSEQIDMPAINYQSYNGRPYTYVYAIADTDLSSAYVQDKLVKINVATGEVKNWVQPLCYPGEPVFIANPRGIVEDDGIIISLVFNAQTETSFLLLLDAQTFIEKARVKLEHHIPFGFHGMFITADEV